MDTATPYIYVVIDNPDEAASVLRSIGGVKPGTPWLVEFMSAPSPSQVEQAVRHLEAAGAESIALLLPAFTSGVCFRVSNAVDCETRCFTDKQRAVTWLAPLAFSVR